MPCPALAPSPALASSLALFLALFLALPCPALPRFITLPHRSDTTWHAGPTAVREVRHVALPCPASSPVPTHLPWPLPCPGLPCPAQPRVDQRLLAQQEDARTLDGLGIFVPTSFRFHHHQKSWQKPGQDRPEFNPLWSVDCRFDRSAFRLSGRRQALAACESQGCRTMITHSHTHTLVLHTPLHKDREIQHKNTPTPVTCPLLTTALIPEPPNPSTP